MGSVSLHPCAHEQKSSQMADTFRDAIITLRVGDSSADFFSQFNEQIESLQTVCPLCSKSIQQIAPSPDPDSHFPLSTFTFSKIEIDPIKISLKSKADEAAEKVDTTLHFHRIELANIVDKGCQSTDGSRAYLGLAEVANDFKALTSAFGAIFGRILYYLPTAWKAHIYIQGMKKAENEHKLNQGWLLSDQDGKTVGTIGLTETSMEKFDLSEELSSKKVYNIGVLLHSDFQRRGVVTQLTEHLYKQLAFTQADMDALWIETRPDNAGVNHIAKKLNFTFLKEAQTEREGFLPILGSIWETHNLYIKNIYEE